MFNLQGSEIIFILLLALVVLGPEKLPGAIKRATQTYAELRKLGTGFQDEFKSAIDQPMREMRETADLIKDQVDPTKIVDEAERAVAAADRAEDKIVSSGDSTADNDGDDEDEGGMEDDERVVAPQGVGGDDAVGDFVDPFDDPMDDPVDDGEETAETAEAGPDASDVAVDGSDESATAPANAEIVDDIAGEPMEESA